MKTRTKLGWVAVLYLAQGFPFGVFQECIPVYLRVHGVSLKEIGFFALLSLPWSVKVFWSPLVDRFGRFQSWIGLALVAMAGLLLFWPTLDPANPTVLLWLAFFGFAVASATQDVAIDGYTITLLDPREVGIANGLRVSAYRVALILGGGGITALAAWFSWPRLFGIVGVLFVVLALVAYRAPAVERPAREEKNTITALLPWLRRRGFVGVLIFILLYKVGDAAMAPMVKPFWVDRGMSLVEIGMISTSLGITASIVGALIGGWFTSRYGLLPGLLFLGLFQAGSNLVYAGVAATGISRAGIYFASLFESFAGGLGTAAFLAFLMSICQKRYAATQYALLTAIFGFSRSIAGAFSGWGTERLGYATYFAATFLIALPAFLLLPYVRRYLKSASEADREDSAPEPA